MEELQEVTAPWIQSQHGKLTAEQKDYVTGCLITAFGFSDDGTPFHSLVLMERRRPCQSAEQQTEFSFDRPQEVK
jgi:hypothetical protein